MVGVPVKRWKVFWLGLVTTGLCLLFALTDLGRVLAGSLWSGFDQSNPAIAFLMIYLPAALLIIGLFLGLTGRKGSFKEDS